MKRLLFIAIAVTIASSAFGQDWRDRRYTPYRDNQFDITPFVGYRWGGTIYADQTSLYSQDVDLQSSANYGVSFGIPTGLSGMKIELMVDRQDTHVTENSGLFRPSGTVGDFHTTYYQAGLLVPFNMHYRRGNYGPTPYFVVSAGVANLDPDIRGVSTATRFAASAGIGVSVPIDRNLSFRVEGRGFFTSMGTDNCNSCYYYNYNHDLYQGEAKVGLSIKF